jgi:hypothetical protein
MRLGRIRAAGTIALTALGGTVHANSEPPASTEPQHEPEWYEQAAEEAFAAHLLDEFSASADISPASPMHLE